MHMIKAQISKYYFILSAESNNDRDSNVKRVS